MTVSKPTGSAELPNLVSPAALAGSNAVLHETMFAEVNDHLRATDSKHLQASLAYLGVVGIVVSILANQPGTLNGPSWLTASVSAVVFLIGVSVLILQRWFRVWKEHYIGILKELVRHAGWDRQPAILPYWLRDHQPAATVTADNVLHYASVVLTGLVGLVMMNTVAFVVAPGSASALLVVFTVLYLAGLVTLHKLVNPDRYQCA